jgi:pimeloyl-ACP methyl ester carboxylesterase
MFSMMEPWQNPAWKPSESTRATVVFVHGAFVRGWEMAPLRHRIAQLGYQERQFRYRSMMRGLDHNLQQLKAFLNETEGDVLHVVGHSMGGVLTRQLFEQQPDPRPGRLIAIGSPLVGCWVGRRVERMHPRLGPWMVGRTVFDYISREQEPVWRGTREFGVIAGSYPFGVGAVFQAHPRPSDGTILLAETKLQGIQDHVTFRLNHFGMLFSKRCTAQVACFLATGEFAPATTSDQELAGDSPTVSEAWLK